MNKFIDGIKLGLGFIFVIGLLFGTIYAIGFHSAEEILPGIFSGNYIFDGKIGIGTSNPDQKLSIQGNESEVWTSIESTNLSAGISIIRPTTSGYATVSLNTRDSATSGYRIGLLGNNNFGIYSNNVSTNILTIEPNGRAYFENGISTNNADFITTGIGYGLVVKDTANGACYRITTTNGAVVPVVVSCP